MTSMSVQKNSRLFAENEESHIPVVHCCSADGGAMLGFRIQLNRHYCEDHACHGAQAENLMRVTQKETHG